MFYICQKRNTRSKRKCSLNAAVPCTYSTFDQRISTDEKSIVDNHCCHITIKFAVGISENQENLPTLYWLPKLHKRP